MRNLDDDVKVRLQRRAIRHGHSMEEEARAISRAAADEDEPAVRTIGLGTRITARFSGLDLAEDIAELRGQQAVPPPLDPE